MNLVCKQIRVTGRVQGVFYRASTKTKALDLGLKGWVKNEIDGSVLMEIEGQVSAIQKMVEWCGDGPIHARVASVEVHDKEAENYTSFEVRY